VIGRSPEFSSWLAVVLQRHLGAAAPDAERLYGALNRVERGLIRVDADEVTYNLHIAVRFELELALVEGRLRVRDLPEAWNAAYAETLGVTPPDDARGCLQDVHWSYGSFGYFPSYTLGNLYAASLARTLEAQVPGMWDGVREGQFGPVLGWLRERVHRAGRTLEPPELIRQVCGPRDAAQDLLDHMWARHGALYGVSRSS
jgi:carboxypeptidase Taq